MTLYLELQLKESCQEATRLAANLNQAVKTLFQTIHGASIVQSALMLIRRVRCQAEKVREAARRVEA